MSTTFCALGDDHINPSIQGLHRVPHRAHHVGNHHLPRVELVNGPAGWHTHRADEELSAFGHDDVDQLREMTMGVVVIRLPEDLSKDVLLTLKNLKWFI